MVFECWVEKLFRTKWQRDKVTGIARYSVLILKKFLSKKKRFVESF